MKIAGMSVKRAAAVLGGGISMSILVRAVCFPDADLATAAIVATVVGGVWGGACAWFLGPEKDDDRRPM